MFKNFSVPKWCGIAGIVFAEIYMFFTVAGPRLQSAEMPLESLIIRIIALGVLFGPFGLALGTGFGLLLQGFIERWKESSGLKASPETSDTPEFSDKKPFTTTDN